VVEFVLFKIMVRKNWRTAKDIGAFRGLSIAISDINQSTRPEVNNHVGAYVSWPDGHKKCENRVRTQDDEEDPRTGNCRNQECSD
jgi:hypothetical protein